MKMALKSFYSYLDTNIGLGKTFNLFAWIFSILVSLYCLILLSLPLYETSAPLGIVFATDNDGGRAVEVSMDTRWYNSNHFAPYGNLYYRLSHTIADLIPLNEKNLNPIETKEKTHNLALKIISLLSLFSLGFFLGWLFFGISPETLLFSSIFTLTTTNVPIWLEWIFRPHPEHLLMVFTALAVYSFGKYLKHKDVKNFILSAMSWGLAMAVKRSTSAFIPAIFIFLLFPLNKESVKKTAQYIGLMLFSYLLIGFPQNFGFYKHIKFLMYESSHHTLADFETIWKGLSLIFSQAWILILPVIASAFFSTKKEDSATPKFLLFIAIGAIPVLLRKLGFPGDHHTMPVVVSLVVFSLMAMLHYNPLRVPKARTLLFIMASVVFLKMHGLPKSYLNAKESHITCRKEIQEIVNILEANVSAENKFLKEAYFPYSDKVKNFIKTEWGFRWEDVTSDIKIIGVYASNYNTYKKGAFIPLGVPGENFEQKVQFYDSLRDRMDTTSPNGVSFKKIYDSCDFELWSRE